MARSSLHYQPANRDNAALLLALIRLAKQYGRYGYRKIAELLRIEGWVVHRGRRTATAEGRVVDAAGKVYAHGSETCLILG